MPSSTDADLIARRCHQVGLDLSAVTSVGRYNDQVDAPFHLPGDRTSSVIVLGNTRAMWPHLDRFVGSSSQPLTDPVDTYVEHVISGVTADIAGVIDVRYSHEPPPRRIAIQRLADVAGLAWLSPSHLCIHPMFGPWIALRAAVVLDQPAPAAASRLEPPCHCSAHCLPKLREALVAGEPTNAAQLIEHWRLWLAMRDACPVGRQHRYDDEQIVYHYIGRRPARWP
jgi:methylmalonic aciduria homocystinuria type C protein